MGKPVALLKTSAEGVPRAGVVNVGLLKVPLVTVGLLMVGLLIVGLVANTGNPVPVAVVLPVPPLDTGTGAFSTVGATCPDESK